VAYGDVPLQITLNDRKRGTSKQIYRQYPSRKPATKSAPNVHHKGDKGRRAWVLTEDGNETFSGVGECDGLDSGGGGDVLEGLIRRGYANRKRRRECERKGAWPRHQENGGEKEKVAGRSSSACRNLQRDQVT
jgi:hypothetical protein